MKRITTILLFLFSILFTLPTAGQNLTKRLDKKMIKEISKEMIDRMKFQGQYRLEPDDEARQFYSPNLIELWEWKSRFTRDTSDFNVNYLKCNDSAIDQFAKKELAKAYKGKTLYDLERRIAYLRVDTVKGDTILFFDTEYGSSGLFETFRFLMNEYPPKGLLEVNGLPIVVYGNIADHFFEVIENAPMRPPLPPHNSIISDDSSVYFIKFINKHYIYKNGVLKRCTKDHFIPRKKRRWSVIYEEERYQPYIRELHK